jgi:hypothetical protein
MIRKAKAGELILAGDAVYIDEDGTVLPNISEEERQRRREMYKIAEGVTRILERPCCEPETLSVTVS